MHNKYLAMAACVALLWSASGLFALGQGDSMSQGSGEQQVGSTGAETCINGYYKRMCTGVICKPCGQTTQTPPVSDGNRYRTRAEAEANLPKNCVVEFVPTTSGGSVIDNISWNYCHLATDYEVGGGHGCASCGAADAGNMLPRVGIGRTHRSRDQTELGSFGPGVFSNYDVKFHIFKSGAGYYIDVFDPYDFYEHRLVDGLEGDTLDGVYVDKRNQTMKDLRLFDAASQPTSNPDLAVTGELRSWSGLLHRFEIISTPLPLWTTGQVAGGIQMNGIDSKIVVPDHNGLDGTDKLTIAFWVKPSTLDGTARGVISKRVSHTSNYAYGVFFHTGNKLHIDIDGLGDRFTSNTVFAVGQWYHVAIVYDGTQPQASRVNLYVNGALDKTAAETSATLPNYASDLQLGFLGGSTYFLDGMLDEVRLYRAALSATDVQGMHTTPGSGPAADLEANWALDETNGLVVSDATTIHPGRFAANRDGRLVRLENRNGYGLSLTYKTFTPAELAASPERQWQLDTVTDAYGQSVSFTYGAAQVGGRWAVSRIDLPNGQHVDYQYGATEQKITKVVHPDSTESTFAYGSNATAQCSTVAFFDPAAEPTSRKKTAYLSNNIAEIDGDVLNQSSLLARMVLNGEGEVSYLNTSDPASHETVVYEGAGRAKRILHGRRVRHFKDGWTFTPGQGYAGFAGDLEDSYAEFPYTNANDYQKGRPPYVTNEVGVRRDFVYDADSFATQMTYSDTTKEKYTYNAFKQATRVKDRLNRVTKRTYDTRGNLLTLEVGILEVSGVDVNQPEYAVYQWEYYPTGHPHQFLKSAEIDANGNRTSYEYNAQGLLEEIIEPDDAGAGFHTAHSFTYDAAGRIETSTDAVGRTVTYLYDHRDRVIKTTYADTSFEETTYGTGANSNLVVQTKDRNGNTTTYAYDAQGRLTTQVTAANDPSVAITRTCTYLDGTNVLAACTDAGETTTYAHDYRQRAVASTAQPRVGVTLTSSTTYLNNLPIVSTDPYGRKSYSVYRASDKTLIRTVQGTVPADGVTNPATQTRDLGPNAKYVITDIVLDAAGQVTKRIDPRAFEHTTLYDSRGRAVETNEAFGTPDVATTQTTYDPNSNVVQIKYPRSFDPTDTYGGLFITATSYTRRNLVLSRTEAFGRLEAATVSYTYNDDGTQNTMVDARLNTWTTLWSPCCADRQVGALDPTSAGTSLQHDFAGNVTFQQALHGAAVFNDVTTRYDARHRPTMQTVWLVPPPVVDPQNPPIAGEDGIPAANGLTTRFQYDDDLDDGVGLDGTLPAHFVGLAVGAGSDGFARMVTNPEGERVLAIQDGLGRTVRSLQLDGVGGAMNSMTALHDTVASIGGYGDVVETSATNALSHTNKSRTDAIGRIIETEDAQAQKVVATFDANGNRLSIRDAISIGVDTLFDARNRGTQRTDTQGDVTRRKFNKHGRVVETTDPKLQVSKTEFDARDRKVAHYDRLHLPSLPSITRWEYDGNSNLTVLTDPETRKTTYTYDSRNLKETEIYPDHVIGQNAGDPDYGIVEFAYDGARRLARRTDQLGDTCTVNYDRANRVTSRDYRLRVNSPAGLIADSEVFTYDNAGRMLTAISGRYSNTVTWGYDDAGRRISESLTIGGQTYTVGSGYDLANRLVTLAYPDGSTVTRSYTDRAQLQEVKYNGGVAASFLYDAGMREVSRTFGNGLVTSRTYRSDNLTETIDTPGVTSFAYTYDANKNKTSETIGGIMAPYGFSTGTTGYDPEDRLINWNRADSLLNQSWLLSLAGDWSTFTANGVPETRNHNASHEISNISGGSPITHDAKGNLTTRHDGRVFAWDFRNLLESTALAGTSVQFRYDALGRRVTKEYGSTIIVYVSTGSQEISEYDQGAPPSLPLRNYTYGTYIDEPLIVVADGVKYYYHANDRFSIAAITDAVANVVERYGYSAYGTPLRFAADGTTLLATSTVGSPWLFTGRRADEETGVYYYRARYYSSELGRFISHDPLGYHESPNLYQYGLASPLQRLDPNGTSSSGKGTKGTQYEQFIEGGARYDSCLIVVYHGDQGLAQGENESMTALTNKLRGTRHWVAEVSPQFADRRTKFDALLEKRLEFPLQAQARPELGCKAMCVVLVGYSQGGKLAVEDLKWFHDKISAKTFDGRPVKPLLAIMTIDAYDREGVTGVGNPAGGPVTSLGESSKVPLFDSKNYWHQPHEKTSIHGVAIPGLKSEQINTGELTRFRDAHPNYDKNQGIQEQSRNSTHQWIDDFVVEKKAADQAILKWADQMSASTYGPPDKK